MLETSSSSSQSALLLNSSNDATATASIVNDNVADGCETSAAAATGNNVELDQDAAMALLKEINADLATGRIRQKMAVSLNLIEEEVLRLFLNCIFVLQKCRNNLQSIL